MTAKVYLKGASKPAGVFEDTVELVCLTDEDGNSCVIWSDGWIEKSRHFGQAEMKRRLAKGVTIET